MRSPSLLGPDRRALQKHLNGNSVDAFATKLSDDGASLLQG